MSKFNLDQTIERRAHAVLEKLLARGGWRDWAQARKYASAARSWCGLRPETRSSRAKGAACHRLWIRVIELCDAHLNSTQE